MSNKLKLVNPVSAAVSIALVSFLAVSTTAVADGNPFSTADLNVGYQLAGEEGEKTAEGSCGGDKGEEGKCGEGKCGSDKGEEGSCGGDKGEEGSCGGDKGEEGSCGGDKG